MTFELHPRLKQDTLFIIDLSLSQLLLMNDKRFPWLVLVPRKMNISEIDELTSSEQIKLMSEIVVLSKMFKQAYHVDKINIAALGNIVPQLHIHIVARYKTDSAWPSTVFGFQKPIAYSSEKVQIIIKEIKSLIPNFSVDGTN